MLLDKNRHQIFKNYLYILEQVFHNVFFFNHVFYVYQVRCECWCLHYTPQDLLTSVLHFNTAELAWYLQTVLQYCIVPSGSLVIRQKWNKWYNSWRRRSYFSLWCLCRWKRKEQYNLPCVWKNVPCLLKKFSKSRNTENAKSYN